MNDTLEHELAELEALPASRYPGTLNDMIHAVCAEVRKLRAEAEALRSLAVRAEKAECAIILWYETEYSMGNDENSKELQDLRKELHDAEIDLKLAALGAAKEKK